jgi:peptidoglycan/LPS O-acetylase OafA/YrhL
MNERWIDYLRATAVMLVFWRHWFGWRSSNIFDTKTLQLIGIYGVIIFFVITSYVLVLSVRRVEGRALNGYAQFIIRRVFRIYPLAIFVVLAAYLLNDLVDTRVVLLSNLLLVQNIVGVKSIIGPLWTLPIEFQMYLFLPIVAAVFISVRRFLTLYAFAVTFGAILIYNKSSGLDVFIWSPVFLVGAACANLGKKIKINTSVVIFFFISSFFSYLWLGRYSQVLGAYIPAILLGVPLLAVDMNRNIFLDELVGYVSKISYGIYLFHGLIIDILSQYVELSSFAALIIYIAGTLFLATLSHKYLERPMIELGKSLSYRIVKIGRNQEGRRSA